MSAECNSALASERAIQPDPRMQLTDEQKQKVSAWIAEGMKLSDIQVLSLIHISEPTRPY